MAFTRSKTGQQQHVLISNYTNKHLTFHKGKYIGHLELIELDSSDQGETHQANSITLRKMMSETVTCLTPLIHLDMNFYTYTRQPQIAIRRT